MYVENQSPIIVHILGDFVPDYLWGIAPGLQWDTSVPRIPTVRTPVSEHSPYRRSRVIRTLHALMHIHYVNCLG